MHRVRAQEHLEKAANVLQKLLMELGIFVLVKKYVLWSGGVLVMVMAMTMVMVMVITAIRAGTAVTETNAPPLT